MIRADYESATVPALRTLARQAGVTGAAVVSASKADLVALLADGVPLPARWLVIFTTTEAPTADLFGNFTEPLLSRCKVFEFTNQGLSKVYAEQAQRVAQAEGLDGRPLASYIRLVQEKHNNLRAVYQEIDAGAMLAV